MSVSKREIRQVRLDYGIQNKILEGESGKIVWNLIMKYLKLQELDSKLGFICFSKR